MKSNTNEQEFITVKEYLAQKPSKLPIDELFEYMKQYFKTEKMK